MSNNGLRIFAVWVAITLLFPVAIVTASQIPIGLDWRKRIFIQEYWIDGHPQYCVANLSYQGINGGCGSHDIVLQQNKQWFRSGEAVLLSLKVSARQGVIIFEKGKNDEYLPVIEPDNIHCTSLVIDVKENKISIDTDQSASTQAFHTLMWRFEAPEVKKPTMFQITAKIRKSEQSWGCFTRGILIAP